MIVVYGIKEYLNPVKAQLSEVIHGCMQSVLGMPEDKRAHRFIPMDAEDFYYPGGRTPAYTVIEINMMQGRAPDTQKALIKELFGKIESEVGISPVDLEVTIKEALISSRARVTVGFFAMLGAVRSAVVIPRSSAATTQREKSSCNPEGLGRFSPVAVSQATTGRTLPAAPCSWPRTKIGLERERGN